MDQTKKAALTMTGLGASGQITSLRNHGTAASVASGPPLALVQGGDTLVLALLDDEIAAASGRVESAMKAAGESVEQLIAASSAARAEILDGDFSRRKPDR